MTLVTPFTLFSENRRSFSLLFRLRTRITRLIIYLFSNSDTSASKYNQQSIVIVPSNTPGVKLVRPMQVVSYKFAFSFCTHLNRATDFVSLLFDSLDTTTHLKVTTKSFTTMFESPRRTWFSDGAKVSKSSKVVSVLDVSTTGELYTLSHLRFACLPRADGSILP